MYIKQLIINVIVFILSSINSFAQNKFYLELIPNDSIGVNLLNKSTHTHIFKDTISLFNFLTDYKLSYIKKNYVSFSIDSITRQDSLYKAFLFVGLKYELNNLYFKNIDNKLIKSLNLKKNKTIHINKLKPIKQQIAHYYENIGYPFIQVKFDSIKIINKQISGTIEVVKGNKFYINSVVIKGKPKISNKFLLNYIKIKKGSIYNQSKINKIEKNIKKLKFLNQEKPTEIEFIENNADIYLYLKNQKSNFFSGIIGFANKEENENKLLITGDLKFVLNNSFKIAEKIDIYWIKFNKNSQNLDFSILFPYLFFIPVGFESTFNLEKQELNYLTTNFKLGFSYSFNNNNNTVKFYYKNKQSFIINKDSVDNNIITDFNNYSFGISFEFDKTDNIDNPLEGSSFLFSLGYGNRSNSEIENNKFIELKFKAAYYLKLTNIFTISIENNSAGLYSDIGFYENEIYKIGGLNSLKGFDEKTIPATFYSIFTIKPKLAIGHNSSLFIFGNIAYYQTDYINSDIISDTPFGFGTGLNFDTKAGIFTLIYALGSQKNNLIKLSSSKVHFGFIGRF